jgi:hypothetical protein
MITNMKEQHIQKITICLCIDLQTEKKQKKFQENYMYLRMIMQYSADYTLDEGEKLNNLI